ncbi:uncharacterized protein MELLADRAFT_110362 [Melampsora larici-populina 98AG31]|uniref:Uncharacterized protein n=1 Tax=Melampsora larici-populina (strain 98AG31 / pathotype 3-4-7) TaxID=747676 RepID=F4RZI9_MELLP|nr:uncharacterized protein MELLADRAFT_110362 [Melampsora larici-populina 98AG31]EGG02250.1 hypothetical protein MELLADRAFT_110362 [Melampsora larici-populina 98AG31]
MEDFAKAAFKLDQHASADGFMHRLFQDHTPSRPSLAPLFSIPVIKREVCSHDNEHLAKVTDDSRTTLHVTTSLFRDSALGYEDTSLLLARWATNGLVYQSGRICCQCHPLDGPQPKPGEEVSDSEIVGNQVNPPIKIKFKIPMSPSKDVTTVKPGKSNKCKAATEKQKAAEDEITLKPSAEEKRKCAAEKRKAAAAKRATSKKAKGK